MYGDKIDKKDVKKKGVLCKCVKKHIFCFFLLTKLEKCDNINKLSHLRQVEKKLLKKLKKVLDKPKTM